MTFRIFPLEFQLLLLTPKSQKSNVWCLKVCSSSQNIQWPIPIYMSMCTYWYHGSMLIFFHFPYWCYCSMWKVSFLSWCFQNIKQKLGVFHDFHIIFWIFFLKMKFYHGLFWDYLQKGTLMTKIVLKGRDFWPYYFKD